MSNTLIPIDGLSDAIKEELDKLNKEVIEQVNVAADTATKEAIKSLKNVSDPKLTGEYAKNWSKKRVSASFGVINYTVYNKKLYMLTHLLEFGHAGPKGKGKRTPAHPHIAKVNQQAAERFTDLVENMKL